MNLHQLQVTYHAEQDRILFRTSFGDKDQPLQEIRSWLTRRIVKNLWLGVIRALETQVTLEQPQASHAKAEIVGMAHQASVNEITARGDFNVPFENKANEYPIGCEPILIAAAHFTLKANEPVLINFTPKSGKGFEIALQPLELHGFCKLLQEAAQSGQWDLDLVLPGALENSSTARVLN